jgi:pimeloyl-ACP methyl ester carboxylesterase
MENFFTIPWFRLFLLLFIVYLIIAVLMWFFGDRLVFPAPRPSTYSEDQVSFTVTVKNKASIACLHLGETDKPKRTVIFSHGNGEDLGNLESFLTYFGSDSTEMIAYDYPGYGLSEGKP